MFSLANFQNITIKLIERPLKITNICKKKNIERCQQEVNKTSTSGTYDDKQNNKFKKLKQLSRERSK